MPSLRADLHVHSLHSGFTSTMPLFRSRDCYSAPESIYRTARARGMDLVAITDHDCIDGCLELLDHHPDATDILMGEEIECRVAGAGIRVHLGALGLTERHHREVQALRGNVVEAAAFLRSEGVVLILHHPFHFFRGEMAVADYLDLMLPLVHAVEVRNGTMAAVHNELAAAVTASWNAAHPLTRLGGTGGSDAHVVGHVGDAFTEAPGRTREEFLESLTRGKTRGLGRHGTYPRFAYEIYGVICNYWGGLAGLRPSGLTGSQRARGAIASLLSLPFQISPLVVTFIQKRGERHRVARWAREWGTDRRPGAGGALEPSKVI